MRAPAGVAQAISPISMKLGQFKGITQKLKIPKWFTFWIQPGGVRPPPLIFPRKPLKLMKICRKNRQLPYTQNSMDSFHLLHGY